MHMNRANIHDKDMNQITKMNSVVDEKRNKKRQIETEGRTGRGRE